jgi:hypothetical protein
VFSTVDEWLRHRLRMMPLKQWTRGTTIYREMRRLGASVDAARQVAMNSRRWWKNSDKLRPTALPTTYDDRMGVPRLANSPQPAEPPDADPHVQVVWEGRSGAYPLPPIPIVQSADRTDYFKASMPAPKLM